MAIATAPVLAYAATIQAGVGIGQSASYTFTVDASAAWMAFVPVIIRFPTNVTAGPQINVYRSTDGGTVYDTIPCYPFGMSRQSGTSQQTSIRLETGRYCVQVLSGGGSAATWTVQVLTQVQYTGINNV